MAIWVTALSVLLIVCLGDFSTVGEDKPDNLEQLIKEVDTKIDNSVDTLKEFFQSTRRNVGQRVRRSWWGRNKGWIVPVLKTGVGLLGRDESSAASAAGVTDNKTQITEGNLEKVNDAIDFLQNIVKTATVVSQAQ